MVCTSERFVWVTIIPCTLCHADLSHTVRAGPSGQGSCQRRTGLQLCGARVQHSRANRLRLLILACVNSSWEPVSYFGLLSVTIPLPVQIKIFCICKRSVRRTGRKGNVWCKTEPGFLWKKSYRDSLCRNQGSQFTSKLDHYRTEGGSGKEVKKVFVCLFVLRLTIGRSRQWLKEC